MIELRFRFDAALRNLVQLGPRRVTAPFVPEPLLEVWAERPAALLTVNNLMYTEPKPMKPEVPALKTRPGNLNHGRGYHPPV